MTKLLSSYFHFVHRNYVLCVFLLLMIYQYTGSCHLQLFCDWRGSNVAKMLGFLQQRRTGDAAAASGKFCEKKLGLGRRGRGSRDSGR